MASFQTETTINISQNATSSPVPSPGATIQVQDTVDRIEDSIKDVLEADQGGVVQTPQAAQPDEEDELYSLSPQAKVSQSTRRAAGQQLDPANRASSKAALDTVVLADGSVGTRREKAEESFSAVDTLLTRGATVHEPDQAKKREASQHASHETGNDEQDELQMSDDGLSGPIGSHPKSIRRPGNQGVGARTQAKGLPGGSKTKPSAKVSSLAALQARRQAQDTGVGLTPPFTTTRTTTTSASSKTVPLARNRNAQTPVRAFANVPQSQHRGTKGKLPPRKGGMFAQTPIASSAATTGRKVQKQAVDEEDNEGNDITVSGAETRLRDKKMPESKGTLKAPPRAAAPRRAKRDTTYDLSGSPPWEEPRQSKRKPHTSKDTPPRKRPKPGADSARSRQTRPTIEATQKQGTNAKTRQAQRESGSAKPLSSRARMQSQSNSKPRETTVRPARAKEDVLGTGHDDSNKENDGNDQGDEKVAGLPDQCDPSVVQHLKGDTRPAPLVEGAPEPSLAHGTTHKPTTTAKRQATAPDVRESVAIQEQSISKGFGASQDNAIVLSDRRQSSPLTELGSPQHRGLPPNAAVENPENPNQEAMSTTLFPKTPTALRSSPPVVTEKTLRADPVGLVDAQMAHKGSFIAFDKSGPLNQGVPSARKRVPDTVKTNRVSMLPTASPLASGASSRARLDAKRRNGPSSAATSVKSYKTNRSAPPSNVADTVDEALDSFLKKHHEKRWNHTATKEVTNEASSRIEPRFEAPQPTPADDTDFMHIDDFDGPTLVNGMHATVEERRPTTAAEPTESQIVMPPPARKASKMQRPAHRAPTVPSMLGSEDKAGPQRSDNTATARSPVKRSLGNEAPDEPIAKRARTARAMEGERHRLPEKPSPLKTTLDVRRSQSLSQQAAGNHSAHFQRGSRKPSRHASRGSQKVDIGGSPVPEGMVLQDNVTVLETFSQQAGLSSDAVVQDTIITRNAAGAPVLGPTTVTQQAMPPSHQPEIMSSNVKPVPASPDAESQAITAVVRTNAREPLVENQAQMPSTDPFNSSEEARKQPRPGSSSSNFLDQLRRQTQHQLSVAKEIQSEEDPDKTLVEPAPYVRPHRRAPSISAASSSESSTMTDHSTASKHDLSTWRNALQPHQMNLFDELVAVSHKLVRHLVDRETAATDIVEDYRRRGSHLVEQMELEHAKQYRKYVDTLNQRKMRLRKDLSECGKKLKEHVGVVVTAQRERKEHVRKRGDTAAQLEDIMAEFC